MVKLISIGNGKLMTHPNGLIEEWVYIALELCQHNTLFDYIIKTGPFKEELAAFCVKELVNGLKAIHKNGLCHRDIKCENLLFDSNGKLKIADFGFAAMAEDLSDRAGTAGQFAPEIEYL